MRCCSTRHGRPGRARPPLALRRCPAAAGGPTAHPLHSAVWRCSGRSRSGVGRPPAWQTLWRGKATQVQEEKVFFDLEDAARIWHVISRAGVAWLMGRRDGRLGALAGASVRAMAADGAKLTGADYIDALERVAALRRRCAELFARTDLVLTPTAAALPWPAETPYPDRIADRAGGPPRSCRVHRLGEHCRPSSDQPAGRGLATRPADRRAVRRRVRWRLGLARIRP